MKNFVLFFLLSFFIEGMFYVDVLKTFMFQFVKTGNDHLCFVYLFPAVCKSIKCDNFHIS